MHEKANTIKISGCSILNPVRKTSNVSLLFSLVSFFSCTGFCVNVFIINILICIYVLYTFQIWPAVRDDASGKAGVAQIDAVLNSTGADLQAALELNSLSSAATVITSITSCLPDNVCLILIFLYINKQFDINQLIHNWNTFIWPTYVFTCCITSVQIYSSPHINIWECKCLKKRYFVANKFKMTLVFCLYRLLLLIL
jgi:hypothetical protein